MKLLKLFAGLVVAFAIAAPATAAEITLKFGHVGAPGSLFAASAEEFAKRVNSQMAGKVKVEVFGASQLGKDKELLQKLKLGTVDFSLPASVMPSVVDEFGLFDMPYLVKDRNHMGRIEDEIFWKKLTCSPCVDALNNRLSTCRDNQCMQAITVDEVLESVLKALKS